MEMYRAVMGAETWFIQGYQVERYLSEGVTVLVSRDGGETWEEVTREA